VTEVHLPMMAGNVPWGWLPTIGLTRLLADQWPELRLRWDRRWMHPVLSSGPDSIEQIIDLVIAQIEGMPGVLPGVDPGYPAPDARRGAALLAPWSGRQAEAWQRALISPSGDIHPVVRPHAAQTLGGVLAKMVSVLRSSPDLVRAGITGLGMTEMYGSGLWILRHTGGPKPAASPGRDWLAVMATPWMPVIETAPGSGRVPVTSAVGWRVDPAGRPVLSWSLPFEDLPAAGLPEYLVAADVERSPRHRWFRNRAKRTDPPMLVSLDGPVTRGRPVGGAIDPDDGELVEFWLRRRTLEDLDRIATEQDAVPDPLNPLPTTRGEVIASLVEGGILEHLARRGGRPQGMDQTVALERLAAYREHRETLHADVLCALSAGANQADVARASGLSAKWVRRIAADR